MNALFDVGYYLRLNSDVARVYRDPLEHYLSRGWAEGRNPNPLFDVSWYLDQNPDVCAKGLNPLRHYVSAGYVEGRSPHPLFDPRFYLELNPDVAEAGVEPLLHFLNHGGREGRAPHPLFDAEFYLEEYRDVGRSEINPLVHFIQEGWRTSRSPHPLFDVKFYLEDNAVDLRPGVDPLTHYLTEGWKRHYRPHPLFDPTWYLAQNPDVAEHGVEPLRHFVEFGGRERRDPNPYFDVTWYTRIYSDVGQDGAKALAHYANAGWRERRSPSARFDTDYYIKENNDVATTGANPLAHFLTCGLKENREPRRTPLLGAHEICGEYASTHLGEVVILGDNRTEPPNEWSGAFAVHLHLFHVDLIDTFFAHLCHIPLEFALFISVPNKLAAELAERRFSKLPRVNLIGVEVVQNRGRDVAPFFVTFGERLSAFDLVCHIHSKKSSHSAEKHDWCMHLLHHLMHSDSHFAQILTLFADNPRLGMAFPVYHPSIRNQIKWGNNFEKVRELCGRLGAPVCEEGLRPFPAGNFFVARTDALRPIFQLGLSLEDFEAETGQEDGTLAHAIERCQTLVTDYLNFTTVQVRSDKPHSLSTTYCDGREYVSQGLERLRQDATASLPSIRLAVGKRVRVAFYTCSKGRLEQLMPFESFIEEADYFYIADSPLSETGFWRFRETAFVESNALKRAFLHKTQPHLLFDDYDIAVWVDEHLSITGDVCPMIDRTIKEGACFGVAPHPYRKDCYEEAARLKRLSKHDPSRVASQVEGYWAEGYTGENGLSETEFIIMDLRRRETRNALDIWHREIDAHSLLDNLSFDYACWKANADTVQVIDNGQSVKASHCFSYFPDGGMTHPYRDVLHRLGGSAHPGARPAGNDVS